MSNQNFANAFILCIGIMTSVLGTVITNYDKHRNANWHKLLAFELFSRANLAFVGYYGTILILVSVAGDKTPSLFIYLMLLVSFFVYVIVLLMAKEGAENIDSLVSQTGSSDSVATFIKNNSKRIVITSFIISFLIAITLGLSRISDIKAQEPIESTTQKQIKF